VITPNEQRKLLLETFYLKPGLEIPEKSEVTDISEVAVQNEIKSLQRSNERLNNQLAALKIHNQELEDYAHTVAHNLKNPLSVIILTSDAITDIIDLTPQELQDYMQQIRSTAYTMNDTIDNLLFLSEVRKANAPTEPVDMAKVITKILKRFKHMIKEYQCTIITPKSWPTALGYAPWIEEVWANYLSNAIKYGGRPPFVRFGATVQPEGMIRFWMLDNGFGIPPETQLQLFSPFNHFSQNHGQGHGLGLSIVYHIVEKLGGKVGVESKAGKGSLFFFTLLASQTTAESIPVNASVAY
jgi:signal transduction histidine kinase